VENPKVGDHTNDAQAEDFFAYRSAVDILAALGPGENPLATHAEQTSCSTRVANRFPPLAHSGEGDKQQDFYFFGNQA